MPSKLQTWVVRASSGEEFQIGGVSGTSRYEGYIDFYDKNDKVQGSFLYPEFYARISDLDGEWE